MRTDPRKGCANEREALGWALLHDAIAHPLMAVTLWRRWTLRFHDWTSHQAWPRCATPQTAEPRTWKIRTNRFGVLTVTEIDPPGCYSVLHGLILHTIRVKATDHHDAARQAQEWFAELVEVIPHSAMHIATDTPRPGDIHG